MIDSTNCSSDVHALLAMNTASRGNATSLLVIVDHKGVMAIAVIMSNSAYTFASCAYTSFLNYKVINKVDQLHLYLQSTRFFEWFIDPLKDKQEFTRKITTLKSPECDQNASNEWSFVDCMEGCSSFNSIE